MELEEKSGRFDQSGIYQEYNWLHYDVSIAVANEFVGESEHRKRFFDELHIHISSYYRSCIVLDLQGVASYSYVTATLKGY